MKDSSFTKLETFSDFIHDSAYVGYMDNYDQATTGFDYICGMMMKPGVAVPEGFVSRTLKPAKVAVGWIKGAKGHEAEICEIAFPLTIKAIEEKGLKPDWSHGWSMEVYNNPRYTTPDAEGNIIIDLYLPCE